VTRLPARRPAWGERAAGGRLSRVARWIRGLAGERPSSPAEQLPELPVVLRREPLAGPYLAAHADGDDRRAAAAASSAAEAAVVARAWWAADAWSHRALWHFERADMSLAATRQARRIGDIRVAGGDPGSARRYYAEAISEARDIGAEREEGLAALGMGRAALDLAEVTTARRLAAVAEELLARAGAPADELAAAKELRGAEKTVGGAAEDAAAEDAADGAEEE
jgi:hypothetical protein